MKRSVSLFLLVCTLFLSLISCGKQPENNNTTNSEPNIKTELSLSERQDLAENELLSETFYSMTHAYNYNYYTLEEQDLNINATKYKIGSVQRNGNTFKFFITFYFYDNYGKLNTTVERTGEVDIDEYGNIERVVTPKFYDTDFY